MTEPIMHITDYETWQTAVDQGCYKPESLSLEGFIHCSRPAQVLAVANAFYHGQRGLILLVIDPDRLACELKWEPPAERFPDHAQANETFPHIYGTLNPEAVIKTLAFEPDTDGRFRSLPHL
jgi:uncharacterized protein (DUF952 family)